MAEKTIDYNALIYQIDQELNRINWSQEKAVNHIQFYYGVKSRMHLKDDELLEFWEFLKSVKTHKKFTIKPLVIKPLRIKHYGEF